MGDEDAELKDVLIRSLNENGILPKIQAQLRAAVYVALEKHNFSEFLKPPNETLRSFVHNDDGLLVASLVVDFLSKMKLDSTLEVLKTEAELDAYTLMTPEKIAEFCDPPKDEGKPLIAHFVSEYRRLASQRSDSRSCTDCQSFSRIPVYRPNILCRPSKRSNRKQSIPNGSIGNGPDDRKISIPATADKTHVDQQQQQPRSTTGGVGTAVSNRQNGSLSRTSGPTGEYGDNDGDSVGNGSQHTPTTTISFTKGGRRTGDHPSRSGGNSPGPLEDDQESQQNAYQEDFESPQSSSESADSHTVTPATTTTSSLHFNSEEAAHSSHGPRSSQAAAHRLHLPPTRPHEASVTPSLEANSHPIIRVYMQTSPRRSRPGQENSSDIDEEDVLEDEDDPAGGEAELEKCVSLTVDTANQAVGASGAATRKGRPHAKPQADEEDSETVTVDQTINSDDSLSLDHAEDVLLPTTSKTGTSRGRR